MIPYNATDVKDKLQCPSKGHMQKFRDIVASYGTFCTIRRTMGADIASACGQLVQKNKEEDASPETTTETVDIEDTIGMGSSKPAGERPAVTKASGADKLADNKREFSPKASWLESLSTEDLDQWTNGLAITAAISASCFVASSLLFMRRR